MRLQNQYFPEIDGLRGLAVALVVIFHAGYQWLPGGFIGVDIFFVISGYLITRQVLQQLSEGRFTFSGFYVRRIRRLAPAMLATIAFTLVVGFAVLSLSDFRRLGPMALTGLFGLANFYFSGKGDYFSSESTADPLLHFWSLAVEEQFYLIAPLATFLVFSRVSFRGVFVVSTIIFFLSFLAAMLLYNDTPRSVFYWPFFRAWEFILGGMLLWLAKPERLLSALMTLFGTLLVLISALTFTADIGGWAAANLIPCAGAALMIAAADNPVKRVIFGNRVSVAIGHISYSLYLVHWPIIVYILYLQVGDHLSAANKVLAIVLSVAAACLLYKLVEQHFRYSQSATKPNGSRNFLLGILLSFLALAGLSISIALSSGWPWRISSVAVHDGEGYGVCKRETFCSLGGDEQKDSSPDIILVGDSHAKHLSAGLSNWVEQRGATALVVTSPSCAPIADMPLPDVDPAACRSIRKELRQVLDKNPTAIVIVVQRWIGYKEMDSLLNGYSKLLKSRPHGSVLLVGQGPELLKHRAYKARCGTMHSFLLPKDTCSTYLRAERITKVNQKLVHFAEQHKFQFTDPHKRLCNGMHCVVELDGYAVFIDRQHISKYAAEVLVEGYLSELPTKELPKKGE